MSTIYNPKSFFITEDPINKLVAPTVNDTFGPVIGSLTSKYRVTSFINGLTGQKIKLFAICDGSIMIFPQKDNVGGLTGKINIIIKPSQMNWSPLKIKYFVYRGVDKDEFFNSGWILKQPVADSPEILTKMWTFFQTLNGLPTISGVVFPVESIFQLNTPSDTLLDEHFTNSLINCKAGEHIGSFTGKVGLDIVLDYGDYRLENQEILFNLDVGYASKDEFIFDISTIPSSTTTKVKRYREHIHQFIDAAAFWGSHIDCGEITIKVGSTQTPKKNVSDINPILEKYTTKDRIYIYIQENNRSFNYYDQTRKIYGFNGSTGEDYKTNDWPILIKSVSSANSNTINFTFDYLVQDIKIQQPERNISVDAVAPNLNRSAYPTTLRPDDTNLSGKTSQVPVTFIKPTGGVPCANFAFFSVRVLQKFPMENHFNHLWIANVKSSLDMNPTEYEMYTCTYDKSRNISLDDTIGETAIIQNKVFFDKGKNATGTTKRRRLYAAVIKNNSNKETEYVDLNIDNPHSTFIKTISNKQDFFLNLFNRKPDFSIYKGTFTDSSLGSGLAAVVNSLCVFNENSLLKKHSYLFLGITEDEYNLFAVPVGADNIFFDLLEDTTFVSENVRKFKLGLRYEDTTGNINATVYYPSSPIFVYSIDDLFFLSKEFSDYQNYFNEFAKARVEFRTIMDQSDSSYSFNPPTSISTSVPFYKGDFGFDWLRIGDNGEPAYGNNGVIVNGYERPSSNDNDTNTTEYKDYIEAYKLLKREYKSLPTDKLDKQYYIPYLNLFSQPYSSRSTNTPKPPFKATLRVLVEIDENLNKLEFDYDTRLFSLNKTILGDKLKTVDSIGNIVKKESVDKTITITCLQDFNETKHIKVLAYPIGVTDKKQAKLAGIILMNKNINPKKVNIVLVKVQTDVTNSSTFEIGWFTNAEKENIYKLIYQSMLCPNIIEEVNNYRLDSNNDFKSGGIYIDGTGVGPFYIKHNQSGLQDFLKNNFLSLNSSYNNYMTIFSFNLSPRPNSSGNVVVGNVQDIGVNNVNLFNLRNDMTLSHESLHGLGLYHTHRDGTMVIDEANRKFIFVHAYDPTPSNPFNATDNYMSYNGDKRKMIWGWQMKIIKRNLK